MTLDNRKISENIASMRGAARLTKTDAAKLLNVTLQTYYKWEKDPVTIPITTLAEIADVFGCRLNTFFKD